MVRDVAVFQGIANTDDGAAQGAARLAQLFVVALLESSPFRDLASYGNASHAGEIWQTFAATLPLVAAALRRQEVDSDSDDDRFQAARLDGVTLDHDSATLAITLQVRSGVTAGVTFTIPTS